MSKPSKKRTRIFSIITYVGEKNIQAVMFNHSRSIRSFAYIYHDKDESVPHHHLLVRTYDAWSPQQIEKWFDYLKLEINENTLVQPASDLHALKEYITHSDYESVKAGKYKYDEKDIYDGGLFDLVEKKDACDETYAILNDVLRGVKTKELIRRYGKNYLYHIQAFDTAKERIIWESDKTMREIVDETTRYVLNQDPIDTIKL